MNVVELIKLMFPYLAPYKKKVYGALVFSFFLAMLKGAQAYIVKPIFDNGLSENSSFEEALKTSAFLILLMVLNFPIRYLHFYWIRYVVSKSTCDVRSEIYRKLQNLPLSFFSESKQGVLISNLLNDTITFSQGFRGVIDLVREPLTAIFMLSLAFYRDWQLSLVIFGVSPLFVWVFNVSGGRVRRQQEVVQLEVGNMTHAIAEGIGAQKLSKAFNLKDFLLMRFRAVQNLFFQAEMKTVKTEEFAHPLVEFIGGIAFAGIIIFAHYRIQTSEMTTGDFASFVAAMALFMDPVRKYSQANIKLSQAKAAGARIFNLLSEKEEVDVGDIKLDGFSRDIEIKDLSFGYRQDRKVLQNVTLRIKKGSKVAFVGLSGSGKSTLINLLLGLYPVSEKTIFIDGVPIEQIKLASLRSLFSLVSQDVFLFNDSVKNNLTVGQDYSNEQIQQALKVAHAKQFVGVLPERENTLIGDRGAKLSGGQCQRLTISRAFLLNRDILLFDEATAALDNESEKIVQKALDKISADKTVIAVAHRLSTIQDFDQIYVFDEGTLIESGTHEGLMFKEGLYSRLYELGQKN